MIRDIFVPLLGANSDDGALAAAITMAQAHGAHISALVTALHPLPLVTEFAYVPLDLDQRQLEAARAAAAAEVTRAQQRLAREEVSSEVDSTEVMMLWSEATAALLARHADISVLGHPGANRQETRFSLTFASLLLHSGGPVLVIPPDATLVLPCRRVVLAWKPTPEASRALHDALPLLAKAAVVDVLMVEPEVQDQQHGQQPGADIARHLARHGLDVNVVSIPREGRDAGANILRYVQEVGADLLVMGGYGHTRWREAVLGGATRAVLEGATKPVLFAH